MARYAHGVSDRVGYGIEGTKYSKAASFDTKVGLINEDIDFPNENPKTPFPTAGKRGPGVYGATEQEHEFDISALVLDADTPFEIALGSRTTTTEVDHTKDLFKEAIRLPTATLFRYQEDLDLTQFYIGCKASLGLTASVGEPLQSTFSITSGIMDYVEAPTAGDKPAVSVPVDKEPFMFWHKGDVLMTDPADDSLVKTVAEVSGIDLSWDNGLEVNHHGDGRDGHSVSEETGAEKYDHSLEVTVVDPDLFKRAADDDIPLDVEVPFRRPPGQSPVTDALIVRLLECEILDAPIRRPVEGKVTADIALGPRDSEIEMRTPL